MSVLDSTAIIVAGMGRCGTTLMYDALVQHGFKKTWFLNTFKDCFIYRYGKVYKTHHYPPASLHYNVKLIYMFGNPFDIVISTTNQINNWGKIHHKHLGSDLFKENNELYFKDTLQLSRHFDKWYRQQNFSFMTIKYEALYEEESRKILNQYLGLKIVLPPYMKRESCWSNHPRKDELIRTYGNLYNKIEHADDARIWERH